MRSTVEDRDLRLSVWLRVREYAVPPTMIESATARRAVGDWRGACAAARVDVDVDLRSAARIHGREFAAGIRTTLHHLAPDLLRWHMPRAGGDGLLRPGLTVSLARFGAGQRPVHLVARTAPAWADAEQRISLALWHGRADPHEVHPRPTPDRRFRLDLHRFMWDARCAADLAERAGADEWRGPLRTAGLPDGCAVHRWAAEAELLRQADGLPGVPVTVRLGRRRLTLDGTAWPPWPAPRIGRRAPARAEPVLPYAATWVLPDLELLRSGLIEAGSLHPLVAAALCPQRRPAGGSASARGDGPPVERQPDWRMVECGGARHRIGVVDGVLAPLDHDPAEARREKLLAALGGTPIPCLQVIDLLHREPGSLTDIRFRLDHGDNLGALDAVEELVGAQAVLVDGALLAELESAVARREAYESYRAGEAGRGPLKLLPGDRRRPDRRTVRLTGCRSGYQVDRRRPRANA